MAFLMRKYIRGINELDNGMVSGHVSLADKQSFDKIAGEDSAQELKTEEKKERTEK